MHDRWQHRNSIIYNKLMFGVVSLHCQCKSNAPIKCNRLYWNLPILKHLDLSSFVSYHANSHLMFKIITICSPIRCNAIRHLLDFLGLLPVCCNQKCYNGITQHCVPNIIILITHIRTHNVINFGPWPRKPYSISNLHQH